MQSDTVLICLAFLHVPIPVYTLHCGRSVSNSVCLNSYIRGTDCNIYKSGYPQATKLNGKSTTCEAEHHAVENGNKNNYNKT
jgi:hypothetical protein